MQKVDEIPTVDIPVELPKKPHRGRMSAEQEEAYVNELTPEQKELYEQRKVARQSYVASTRDGTTGNRRRRDGLDADITGTELSGIIKHIFEGLSAILDSDSEWTDEEFNQISKGFLVVINRVQRLRIMVRLLTPITSVVALIQKVRKLQNGRNKQAKVHTVANNPPQQWPDQTA